MHSLLWHWSQRFGKYVGLPCSAKALRHYRRKGLRGLRHDHAVPRNMLVKLFFQMRRPVSSAQALKVLKKYGRAMIITQDEDRKLNQKGLRQKMPKRWNWKNPLARYKAARIKLAKKKLRLRKG